jgi:hypothetical protein
VRSERFDKLPAIDGRGCAGYLLVTLRDHPERQVRSWLEGLSPASDLMTVSQRMST